MPASRRAEPAPCISGVTPTSTVVASVRGEPVGSVASLVKGRSVALDGVVAGLAFAQHGLPAPVPAWTGVGACALARTGPDCVPLNQHVASLCAGHDAVGLLVAAGDNEPEDAGRAANRGVPAPAVLDALLAVGQREVVVLVAERHHGAGGPTADAVLAGLVSGRVVDHALLEADEQDTGRAELWRPWGPDVRPGAAALPAALLAAERLGLGAVVWQPDAPSRRRLTGRGARAVLSHSHRRAESHWRHLASRTWPPLAPAPEIAGYTHVLPASGRSVPEVLELAPLARARTDGRRPRPAAPPVDVPPTLERAVAAGLVAPDRLTALGTLLDTTAGRALLAVELWLGHAGDAAVPVVGRDPRSSGEVLPGSDDEVAGVLTAALAAVTPG